MRVRQPFLRKNENILKIIAFLFGICKYTQYIYNIIITQKQRDMKTVTTTKYNRVENTDQEFLNEGIVAFQLVKFTINFYGNEIETTHDTKIMKDGRQIVIGGCGYIKEGYELN